jgi:hypothetical protein
MLSRSWSFAVLLALVGCGGSDEPAAQPAARPEPKAARPTVFDPLTGTIDRAKGVQQTVDEQAAEQRRRIEEAER